MNTYKGYVIMRPISAQAHVERGGQTASSSLNIRENKDICVLYNNLCVLRQP